MAQRLYQTLPSKSLPWNMHGPVEPPYKPLSFQVPYRIQSRILELRQATVISMSTTVLSVSLVTTMQQVPPALRLLTPKSVRLSVPTAM